MGVLIMKKRILRTKDDKEYQRRVDELNKVKITCKCGRKVVVPVFIDKQLCSWCGNYVYRNKQVEFKEKMKQRLKEV